MRVKRFLIFFIFFFLGCQFKPELAEVKVVEVIDGDTIKLESGKLLRYIGIDTPEVRIKVGNDFIYDPQPLSLEATELNRELVEGKFVRIEFDVQRYDKYGRLLGYCFIDDVFVNSKLIEDGLATVYTYPPNVKYTESFVSAQKKARAQDKGLWQGYEVIESGDAHKFINQTKAVRGQVLNSYKTEKVLFLNFGTNHKTDFTVVIFKNCFKYFDDLNISPDTFYKGKIIEVSGRIKEYNGPEIIVCGPNEIKVIDEK